MLPRTSALAAFGVLTLQACQSTPNLTNVTVEKLGGDMQFTEGPVWLPEENKLVFSDIPRAVLMQWSEEDGVTKYRDSANPNGNLLDEKGRLLTCRHGTRDIIRTDAEGTRQILVTHYDGKRLNSPNDLTVQRDGVIWFTDPPWGLPQQREGREQPFNHVFRFDPVTRRCHAVLKNHRMPNGIALSPDERVLYVADTGGHPSHPEPELREGPATISAYALRQDGFLVPDPLWQIPTRCDGMCLDEHGNLYATGREGITVWSPGGQPLGAIPMPEQPANCCFGGADSRTLFVTARTSLYCVRLDVRGHRPLAKPEE